MFQVISDQTQSSFKKFAFSEKVWRCLERAEGRRKSNISVADTSEILFLMQKARQSLSLCSDELITRILDLNPKAIQLCRKGDQHIGLLAILPLNARGMAALGHDQFSGKQPELDWICKPHEKPECLYVWLVFMPGNFGQNLAAIGEAIDRLGPIDCPLFSQAATEHSQRLHAAAGFMPARQFYPSCAERLQVVFPMRSLESPARGIVDVRIARTMDDIMKVFAVRSSTYIAEQYCLYDEEYDGNDFCATQLLGSIDGDAAGCVRLRFFGDFAKLERLAVRREYRTSKLAYKLVRAALEHCRLKGYTRVYGHSRLDLVRFWRVFGFRQVEDRPEFSFANVRYSEILAELDPHPGAIKLGADPMMTIRPEGQWDRPGPFDLSLSAFDPRRRALLEESTRTIRHQSVAA